MPSPEGATVEVRKSCRFAGGLQPKAIVSRLHLFRNRFSHSKLSQAPLSDEIGKSFRARQSVGPSGSTVNLVFKGEKVMKFNLEIRRGQRACKNTSIATLVAPQRQALDSASSDYLLEIRASGRSPMTIASYAESLAHLKKFFGPTIPLQAISADSLHAAVANLAVTTTGSRGFIRRSETTLNRHRSAYRAFFNWAFLTGRTPINPAILLRRSGAESIPTPPITQDEVDLFLSAIRLSQDPLRLRDEALFATYAFAGLRRMEALLLNVSDYDAKGAILRVKNGKGRRSRNVPLVLQLNQLLNRFLENRLATSDAGTGELFPGRSPHGSLTPRQVQRRFEHWRTMAGLRPVLTIHSFRAGFATTLHHHSRDIILVSRALGHKDIRPTLRYIDPHASNLAQTMEVAFCKNSLRS
jgi:integrase/recombinase XerC